MTDDIVTETYASTAFNSKYKFHIINMAVYEDRHVTSIITASRIYEEETKMDYWMLSSTSDYLFLLHPEMTTSREGIVSVDDLVSGGMPNNVAQRVHSALYKNNPITDPIVFDGEIIEGLLERKIRLSNLTEPEIKYIEEIINTELINN